MGIDIIVYTNEDDFESFYLGNFTALFSQITSSILQNMPVFSHLIDESYTEDDYFIESEDIKRLINEIQSFLLSNDANYLSYNLRGSLQDFLDFFSNKNLDSWKITIA